MFVRRPHILQTILKHIKSGEFSHIYLLYGEEAYDIRKCRKMLTDNILSEPVQGNMNYHRFDGPSSDTSDLAQQIMSLPFFSDRQLIVVEGSGLFKSSNSLCDILSDMPDSTYIIFIESAIDKRNSLYKYVKDNGTVAELNHESDRSLPMWIAGYLNRYGCKITMRAAKLIISKAGVDKTALSCELEKIIAYSGETKEIDTPAVEAICTSILSSRIFTMMDYIVSGKKAEALNLYRDLVLAKESPSKILSLLTRHYNILAQIKDISHETDMNIAKLLSIPSFAVKKYKSQAGMYNRHELITRINCCVEAETDFKTGKIQPQIAIETLIIQLAS